jgi:hypothetical protein
VIYFLYKNEYRIFKTAEITIIRRQREKGGSLFFKIGGQGRKTVPIWGLLPVKGRDIRKG